MLRFLAGVMIAAFVVLIVGRDIERTLYPPSPSVSSADKRPAPLPPPLPEAARKPPREKHGKAQVSDIGLTLRFTNPESPNVVIANPSDSIAREIVWRIVVWNMDLTDQITDPRSRLSPLPVPAGGIGWIKPHHEISRGEVFRNVASLLKPSNRLVGAASVDCPECIGKTYFVYIVYGKGGWYAEAKGYDGGIPMPTRMTIDQYAVAIAASVPENMRIPIGN